MRILGIDPGYAIVGYGALDYASSRFHVVEYGAIDVAQARGVILLAACQAGVPTFQYTPMQVKQAVVGYGKAEKAQVMEMTRRLLGLKAVPRPDDTADALAVAICHGHTGSSSLTRKLDLLR